MCDNSLNIKKDKKKSSWQHREKALTNFAVTFAANKKKLDRKLRSAQVGKIKKKSSLLTRRRNSPTNYYVSEELAGALLLFFLWPDVSLSLFVRLEVYKQLEC